VPYFFCLPRTSGDYINDIGDIGHNPDPLRSDRRNRSRSGGAYDLNNIFAPGGVDE
jgi:hypothetical protein